MNKKKVGVGLSGGVDSGTTALILKERGYEVVGMTMKLFDHHDAEISVAREVADRLGIEHIVLDYSESFESTVVEYTVKSYELGLTPNPCVFCNRHFKYGKLLDYCMENGIDYFATGHYARISYDEDRGIYRIFKAKDSRKDQSYNLFQLSQEQLKHLIFPLGDFSSKAEVREKSSGALSELSSKKDSTGICFLNKISLYSFLKKRNSSSTVPGAFVDRAGNFLGRHVGISSYTLGQKKNLPKPNGESFVVCGIDSSENKVILGSEADLLKTEISLADVNLLDPLMSFPATVEVKLSQWSVVYSGELSSVGGEFKLSFKSPVRAPAPGQSVVFYSGNELLGGGTIYSAV